MYETILSRIGKLLFPRLAPDQRHQRMVIILLVVLTSLVSVGALALWMMSMRGLHIVTSTSLPAALK